jgi:hypothetical protein
MVFFGAAFFGIAQIPQNKLRTVNFMLGILAAHEKAPRQRGNGLRAAPAPHPNPLPGVPRSTEERE